MSWRWAGDVTGAQLPRVEPPVCGDQRGRAGPKQRAGVQRPAVENQSRAQADRWNTNSLQQTPSVTGPKPPNHFGSSLQL